MRQYHEAVDAAVVEARLKAFFEDDPRGAVAVYLFGSVARGEAGPESDVDVGILFATDPPATLGAPQFAIEAALERLLGSPVQVVLRDGRLVLDRDRVARIRFEVRSRNEYFDLAPIRRLYRRYPAPATAGRVAEPRR
jgi:predicted nucleotidyltransferase